MNLTLLIALIGMSATPHVFLFPEDLQESAGVRLEAQVPEAGLVLIGKDASRPKLWYAPVATLPEGDAIRIWYQRVDNGEAEYADQRTLCVGDIRGGAWQIPALQPDAPAWGGPNNVCMTRSPHKPTWGGFNVFQLTQHEGRLHMLYWDQPDEQGLAGAMLATSADGLAWEKHPGTVFTEHNDAYTLMKQGGEYWLYQTMLEDWKDKPIADNLGDKRRVQSLRRSSDLKTWSPQEIILRPDDNDPPEAEFYLMKTIPCGGGFAGLLMKYYADPKLEGKHSGIIVNELIASRDGQAWQRPFRETDIGFWAYADPFEIDGKMHFAIWKDGGMETVAYGKDRLTAVVADAAGSFVTAPLEDAGLPATLNADARQGWIEVSVLDAAGKPLPDFGRCRIEGQNGQAIPLVWKSHSPVPGMRLHLTMEKSKLFALN